MNIHMTETELTISIFTKNITDHKAKQIIIWINCDKRQQGKVFDEITLKLWVCI